MSDATTPPLTGPWRSRPTRLGGHLLSIVVLTVLWISLWGDLSWGNLVAGVVVAAVAVAFFAPTGGVGVRPVPLLRLLGLVAYDLAASTVTVAREVLTPTDYTDEVLVEVELGDAGRRHPLLIASAVTLTPGTAVVESDPETGTVLLHLLHAERRNDTIAHVRRLAELADLAMPHGERPAGALTDRSSSR